VTTPHWRSAAAGQIARQDHHDHHGDQQPPRQRENDLVRQPVHVEVECRRASSPAAAPKSGAENHQQRRQLGEVRLATWNVNSIKQRVPWLLPSLAIMV
jgi:hypothetical protein